MRKLNALQQPQSDEQPHALRSQQSRHTKITKDEARPIESSQPTAKPVAISSIQNCTNLTIDDFEVTKVLGRGTFGIVRQVRCLLDGKTYAVKSIPL